MKRFSSSYSPGALLSPPPEEKKNSVYNREFQSMLDSLDEEGNSEENEGMTEKKRRLNIDQVKALEKIFERDNKLDPDRKVKIAQELGLQPRQVAVWFQNRRARWKGKQLEKDYDHLKADYEALKLNYEKTEQERETLITELKELQSKLGEGNAGNNYSVEKKVALILGSDKDSNTICQGLNNVSFVDFKDGLSDSESSGVLNDEANLNLTSPQQRMVSVSPALASSSPRFDYVNLLLPSSPLSSSQPLDSRLIPTKTHHQQPSAKVEDQTVLFGSEDESCNIFSIDPAPSLCWYLPP